MNQSVMEMEQHQVDRAYARAEQQLEDLAKPAQGAHASAAQKVFEQRMAQHAALDELVRNPDQLLVVARVDLEEPLDDGDDRETYYLGVTHLAEEDHRAAMLVGWQSKLGRRLFYSDGNDFLQRRMRFEGRKRRITSIDTEVWVDGQLEPDTVDPLLRRLDQTVDGALRNAVSTIQGDQYDLMEQDPDTVMVVQGAPGTGKTIIGLHRVSVMVFRSEGKMTESDVLVVGPSPVFLDYIRSLLPSIGQGRVPQVDIGAVGQTSDARVSGEDHVDAAKVKGSALMPGVIARYLDGRIRFDPDEDVSISGAGTVSAEAIRDVIMRAKDERATYNDRRAYLRTALASLFGLPSNDLAPAMRRDLENLLNRVAETRSPREVVAALLSSRILLEEAATGLLTSAEQAEILRDEQRLADVAWTINDVALMDEAATQLSGRTATSRTYRHIVVDEAQDLSPMQLRMLRRRSSGGMTILGDLAQGTSPWRSLTWEDHLTVKGGIEIDHRAELAQVYRTTQPLVAFANRLLPTIDVDVPEATSVLRDGPEPRTLSVDDLQGLVGATIQQIEEILTSDDPGTIGVIGLEEHLDEVWVDVAAWAVDSGVKLAWASDTLRERLTFAPARQAKGLEFDHVIVLEAGAINRTDPTTGPGLLYVAMTRARTGLCLLHRSRLPRALSNDDSAPTLRTEAPAATVDVAEVETGNGASSDHDDTTPPLSSSMDNRGAIGDDSDSLIPVADTSAPGVDSPEAGTSSTAGDSAGAELVAGDDWTWWVRSDGGGCVVRVEGQRVSIERLPASSGPLRLVARGWVMVDGGVAAWSLQAAGGEVHGFETPSSPEVAAELVVARLITGGSA